MGERFSDYVLINDFRTDFLQSLSPCVTHPKCMFARKKMIIIIFGGLIFLCLLPII